MNKAKECIMYSLTTIILAAGHGKRMKSNLPKVLHEVAFKPMLQHIIDLSNELNSQQVVCVVGHGKDQVMTNVQGENLFFVEQKEQLGTGHAVLMGEAYMDDGDVLVLCGDTPLLKKEMLQAFVEEHRSNGHSASLISMKMPNPTGYGRIVRDENLAFEKIVEQKDANDYQLKISEVNSGIGIFKGSILRTALKGLKNNNSQGEYYLTDVFEAIKKQGQTVGIFMADEPETLMGVNDRIALAEAEKIMQNRMINHHMEQGVTFINPESVTLGSDVIIGQDTIIYPQCVIRGKTNIGSNCKIGPGADINQTQISDHSHVFHSTLVDSVVGSETAVGPYAYLRPQSIIGDRVKVGDFVEIKNAVIGNDTKISHLSYVGDAEVGEKVNLGCGVVFVNYDGKHKHKTIVKSNAFVGCNSNLIAPVTVEEGAYVAAGSTITDDVPENALAIARQRQVNKTNWSKK